MAENKNVPFDSQNLCQIAIVVRSIKETVKFYEEVFGIGPFTFSEVDFPTATYYGQPGGYRGKRAFARLGPVTLEIIELLEGKTVHADFLKEKGEGLQHIGFAVKDLKVAVAKAEQKGLKVIQGFTREDGSGFVYLDSDKIGGVMFEMIQDFFPKV